MAKRATENSPLTFLSYAKSTIAIFPTSLKSAGWRLAPLAFLDFLFYFGCYWVLRFAFQALKQKYAAIPFPETLNGISPEQAALLLGQAKSFVYGVIGGILLVFVGIILLWTLLKTLIWALTLKQRPTSVHFWKFFLFGAIWTSFWLTLFAFLAYLANLLQLKFLLFTLIALFIILGNSILTLFTMEPTWKAVKRGFSLTFTKLHYLALPYFTLFSLYVISMKLLGLIPGAKIKIFLLAFTLLFIAASRAYLAQLILAIDLEKFK